MLVHSHVSVVTASWPCKRVRPSPAYSVAVPPAAIDCTELRRQFHLRHRPHVRAVLQVEVELQLVIPAELLLERQVRGDLHHALVPPRRGAFVRGDSSCCRLDCYCYCHCYCPSYCLRLRNRYAPRAVTVTRARR